jgi:selenocysteine-specific elongation factor
VRPASKARPDRSVDRVVAERGWLEVEHLERLTGEHRPATVGRWVVSPEALQRTTDQVRRALADSGPLGIDLAGLDERQRHVLGQLGDVTVEGGRARPASIADPLAEHPYVAALQAQPFSPPEPSGVDRAELRQLVGRGLVIERDGTYFAATAIEEAAGRLSRLLQDFPEGVTVAQVRDALGTTRKHVLPLLGYLDASGYTRRRGDVRVAGPRLGG